MKSGSCEVERRMVKQPPPPDDVLWLVVSVRRPRRASSNACLLTMFLSSIRCALVSGKTAWRKILGVLFQVTFWTQWTTALVPKLCEEHG